MNACSPQHIHTTVTKTAAGLCLSSHDIETSGLGSLQSKSGAEGCQECGCVVTKNCVQSSGLMFFSESFNFQKSVC